MAELRGSVCWEALSGVSLPDTVKVQALAQVVSQIPGGVRLLVMGHT